MTVSSSLALPCWGIAFWFAAWGLPDCAAQPPQPMPARPADAGMWVTPIDEASLPAGVSHRVFRSAAMGHDVGYCIYLPPGYAADETRRYPVIYHLHGAGGNETTTLFNAEALHAEIVAGRWPEMIMVFPNGGRATKHQDSADGRFRSETAFIKELIPHVDATYRTIAARHGRCIEGFSAGGLGSTTLALKHPDLFCSLCNQAGNVYPIARMQPSDFGANWPFGYHDNDPERIKDHDPHVLLERNIERIKGKLRIRIVCGTRDRSHLGTIREFHQLLLKHGVDHTYIELEALGHDQRKLIATFGPAWFDYHVESLRHAAAEADRNR